MPQQQLLRSSKRPALAFILAATVASSLILIGFRAVERPMDQISVFGPSPVTNPAGEGGVNQILIGLLLPAVQQRVNFEVLVMTRDAEIVMPVPSQVVRKAASFDVFLTFDPNQNSHLLTVVERGTNRVRTAKTKFNEVTVEVHPAKREDGTFVMPISSSATVHGFRSTQFDGKNLRMPIEYSLPPTNRVVAPID